MSIVNKIYIVPNVDDIPTLLYAANNLPSGYSPYKVGMDGKRVYDKKPRPTLKNPLEHYILNNERWGSWTYWSDNFFRALTGTMNSNNPHSVVQSGSGRFLHKTSTLIDLNNSNILVMGVGVSNPKTFSNEGDDSLHR